MIDLQQTGLLLLSIPAIFFWIGFWVKWGNENDSINRMFLGIFSPLILLGLYFLL